MFDYKLQMLSVEASPHHCSTICEANGFVLIAGYCGQECTDKQRVFLTTEKEKVFLNHKTGNPLLINDNGKTWIFYSLYEDKGLKGEVPKHPVQRWMYCSNWLAEVKVRDDGMIIVCEPERIDEAFGLLARCAPYRYKGQLLIPLYRERDPVCSIWTFSDGKISHWVDFGQIDDEWIKKNNVRMGNLGYGAAIQPTLFENSEGNLVALCRNVCKKGYSEYAWTTFAYDEDLKEWSDLDMSVWPNFNSSILALGEWDVPLLVLNEDLYRTNIFLCNPRDKRKFSLGRPTTKVKTGGISYPNYMVADNGDVHIVHTNRGKIAHHVFDHEFLVDVIG